MINVDKYFNRNFDLATYNCWDFLREVWLDLTGNDVGKRTPQPPTALAMRRKFIKEQSDFKEIDAPKEPCIVLMCRVKTTPHVGVFLRNKVLSISERGVTFVPIAVATHGFTDIRYFE